jgi:hypothetical protein
MFATSICWYSPNRTNITSRRSIIAKHLRKYSPDFPFVIRMTQGDNIINETIQISASFDFTDKQLIASYFSCKRKLIVKNEFMKNYIYKQILVLLNTLIEFRKSIQYNENFKVNKWILKVLIKFLHVTAKLETKFYTKLGI